MQNEVKIITGFGKTTQILWEAAAKQVPLIVHSEYEARRLRETAEEMDIRVPVILSASAAKSYFLGREKPRAVMVDNAEYVLQGLLGIPVDTMTSQAEEVDIQTRDADTHTWQRKTVRTGRGIRFS